MRSKLNYGIILGLVQIAGGLVTYLLGPEIFATNFFIPILVSLGFGVLGIGLIYYFGIKLRAENGGYFSFGQAFGGLMIMTIISTVLAGIFSVLLNVVIDPDYGQAVLDATSEMLANQGLDEAQIEASMASAENPSSPMAVVKSLGGSLVFAAIVNLIIAAIIKKNPDNGFDESDEILA